VFRLMQHVNREYTWGCDKSKLLSQPLFLFYVSGILGERLRIRKFLYNCGERLVFKAFRAQGGCCKAKNTRDKKVGMVVYKDLKA
ncbi:hypothetical protein, partial [Liquorilactobacillus satsumensis]|uniref:hypothetical protein n=1 Tax=Liquorilactobacillus satsumensis TaxID=259059 RepID=UPI0039E74180